MKAALLVAAAAVGAITVTTLPRPPFPGPAATAPSAKRLVVVSSRKITPGLGSDLSCHVFGVPKTVRGLPLQWAICPGGPNFALYGRDGASARILLSSKGYSFDFKNYAWPPRIRPGEREFVYEEIVWAREAGGVLYVENAHLTYAKSSYGQNAYVTAIDVKTGKRLWRSKALVANAANFVVAGDYLVTGYGFTAEPDWLYLLDRKTGRIAERLSLPSGPERLTKTGASIRVRTYDHVVVVKLRKS